MSARPAAAPRPSSLRRWSRLPVPARRALVAARRLGHPGHRPHPRVDVEVIDGVATLTLDDGKVNAISREMNGAISSALDRVQADERVRALVITGRPRQFCAGFDLDTLMVGGKARDEMIRDGWTVIGRVLTLELPVVTACTGNAVAAGAALLLTGDSRFATEGPFRIGFNEASIGLPLPGAVLMLAADRLHRDAFDEAMYDARMYRPPDALAAGFVHRVVAAAELLDAAVAEARRLGDRPDFRSDKASRVAPLAERMRRQAVEDVRLIGRIGA